MKQLDLSKKELKLMLITDSNIKSFFCQRDRRLFFLSIFIMIKLLFLMKHLNLYLAKYSKILWIFKMHFLILMTTN